LKRLTIDIETRPNLAYVWRLWDQNVSLPALIESVDVLSFAAKWYGKKPIIFKSVYHDGEEAMIQAAYELLDEADAVIHYNGKRFDTPHLNRKFLESGMQPPSPFKEIDLLETVKKKFAFPSNKLEYVLQALGIGHKLKHEGFDMWVKCLAGDEKAWRTMKAYNIQDVRETEKLYDYLLPWIVGHPSFGAETGQDVCPTCGSPDLVREGYAYTATGKFQRFSCSACGHWSRATRRTEGTHITNVAS
jgi:hypothetical protein